MKILVFTTLYPNKEQIRHGIFIEQRIRQLKEKQNIEVKVVAPVPWFPFKGDFFKKYSTFAKVPKLENRYGIDILHPKFPVIPKIGMSVAPFLMAFSMYHELRKIIYSGFDFDIIDAHFFFPDGVAALLLGKWLKKKVVITARGTDISIYPDKYWFPGKMIRWAINNSNAVVTVCKALADKIKTLDVKQKNIYVFRNGVDLKLFKPVLNREKLRNKYQVKGTVLLSVGNFVPLKGHHLIIEALVDLPEMSLILIGSGPMEEELKKIAFSYNIEQRVHFVGVVSQNILSEYYAISDCLVLASSREGWANVLLESMACGTPVVATDIWGTPEVVASPDAGLLIKNRTANAISKGVKDLLSNYPERKRVRKYAEKFSWDETSQGLFNMYNNIKHQHK